ncbi:MAG TPA: hypothetical protein VKU83_03785, partial [Puia sp.]|nr:hypothetical protein [Puia sp.]
QQSRVAAVLLLTLRGTPTLYYGDELGMRDVPIPPEEVRDPQGLNMPGKNLSRDPERTPMLWDAHPNAGFSATKPWLRVDPTWQRCNVSTQKNDDYSQLHLYKKLIDLRQHSPALKTGTYRPVYSDQQLIAYIRYTEDQPAFLVVLNLTHRPGYFTPSTISFTGVIIIDTLPENEGSSVKNAIYLFGDEAMVIRLDEWQAISTSPPHEPSTMP